MAARELVGGGGSVRRVREKGSRGGGGRVRESEGVPGGGVARMEASGVSRWSGKQEVAGACAGVRRPRACAYWREEEGDRGGSGDGLGRAAGPGGLPGERQVVLLSFISVLFLFSISAICF